MLQFVTFYPNYHLPQEVVSFHTRSSWLPDCTALGLSVRVIFYFISLRTFKWKHHEHLKPTQTCFHILVSYCHFDHEVSYCSVKVWAEVTLWHHFNSGFLFWQSCPGCDGICWTGFSLIVHKKPSEQVQQILRQKVVYFSFYWSTVVTSNKRLAELVNFCYT